MSALDFVRNNILEWTLELEKRGVLGNDLSFDSNDKAEARAVTNHIYAGNIGVLGNVSGNANNSDLINLTTIDPGKLQTFLMQASQAAKGLDEKTRAAAEPLISEIAQEAHSRSDGGRVPALIGSLKQVLEGAGGNIVAAAILSAMANIL